MQSTCSQTQFPSSTVDLNAAYAQLPNLKVVEAPQWSVPLLASQQDSVDELPTRATPSVGLIRSGECTRACQDMVSSAGIAAVSGAAMGLMGLASLQAACFFVAGSVVAYSIAIHRILALRTCRRTDPESGRAKS